MKAFITSMVLVFLSVMLNAQSFSVLLERIQALPLPEKQKLLDDYFDGSHTVPVIENNTVYFIFRGDADQVSIAGDATAWAPSMEMQRIEGSSYWFCKAQYEPDARLEYKVVVNGSKWMLDPMNLKVVNGGMGQNSELVMPGCQPALYIHERDVVPWGTYSDTVIYSKYLKQKRPIRIYLPPRYEVTDALYPLLICHDGYEMFDRMAIRDVIDNMAYEHKIRPVIAVFIQPVKRDAEYSGKLQKKYTRFVCRELLPFIDANFRTIKEADRRATAGISNGGNISLWLAATHPELFGKVIAQSSNVESNVLKAFKENDLSKSQVYLDFGRYDIPALVPRIQALKKILEERSIRYEYHEFPEGHNWASWQKHFPEALEYQFPAN